MKVRKKIKKLSLFMIVIMLVIGSTVTAFAADSKITFDNNKLVVCEPGSVYSDTDLFENLKGVMPGDIRKEEISIVNQCGQCDYIKVYLRAMLHDESGNPISEKVLAELQADSRKGAESDLEYMYDFLAQLTMKVTQDGKVIYQESPDALAGLADNVYLGELRRDQKIKLEAELTVPVEMGNEYMSRIGEVDWVFTVEGFDDPEPEPEPTPEPTPLPPSIPQTGDTTALVPYMVLLFVSISAIVLLLIYLSKGQKKR